MDKIEKDEDVFKIFTSNPQKRLCNKTIHYYLTTFKEFMRYAEKEEIISNSLNLFVETPAKIAKHPREPFTSEDLKKIFNPKTYIEEQDDARNKMLDYMYEKGVEIADCNDFVDIHLDWMLNA